MTQRICNRVTTRRATVLSVAADPHAAAVIVLLILLPLAGRAVADPNYGSPLPGFDPVVRATDDPRLLGVERQLLRRNLLAQGFDPLVDSGGPDLGTAMRAVMLEAIQVDLKREVTIAERNGDLGLFTVFRYPEYFFLFQNPRRLPGGFVYYPPRPVTAQEVNLFVDDIDSALMRTSELARVTVVREGLDVAGRGKTDRDEGLLNLTIPIKLPRTLEKIIGRGEKTQIKISGRERIAISGESTVSSNFIPTERVQSQSLFPTLDMEQELQINLSGTIGEKIIIEVDHNSAIIGPDATRIKLAYRGDEDEVIQAIETGDVGLTLPGGQLLGYSSSKGGLFGIKVTGQVGRTDFTVVASKQKAESSSKSFNARGGEETEHVIESWRYLNNRFFRLDLPPWADPGISSGVQYWQHPDFPGRSSDLVIDPSTIQLYRFMGAIQPGPEDIENVAAIADTTGIWDLSWATDADYVTGQFWRAQEFTLLLDVNESPIALDVGNELQRTDIIAIVYNVVDQDGNIVYRIGDRPGTDEGQRVDIGGVLHYRMKLLKPDQAEPYTFQYVLRNIYALGGANIDPESFDLRIERNEPDVHPEQDYGDAGSLMFIRLFGLDETDTQGNLGHDGLVDKQNPYLFDLQRGLLLFPLDFPEPFNGHQVQYEAFADTSAFVWESSFLSGAGNLTPEIYDADTNPNQYNQYGRFKLVATHAAATSSFNLGVSNIEEGSETVLLDGKALVRDVDYEIDYTFGQITLKGDAANLSADSQVSVDYQYAPFFGGGKSNLAGFNLGYDLGPQSTIFSTWLYKSTSIIGHKAKLGEEPSRTIVGNLGLQHTFKPYFLTHVANFLSRVNTEKESTFAINGEAAVSLPNPNTRDDAFVEDFEGIDSSDIISLTRQSWHWASVPVHGQDAGYQQATGDYRDYDATDRVETNRWFIPKDRVLRRYLNPDLVESERNETQHAMNLYMRAEDGIWDQEDWGGIMRGISRAGLDLSKSQFLEFWINDGVPDLEQRSGKLHIDFGFIDEDFYWDFPEGLVTGTFDDEDTNGDGVFVADEDIGLDGTEDRRVYDAAFIDYGDPYPGINYTETNNLRDSEDLNGNTRFDRSNGFFTMTVDLKETQPLVDVVYDYDDVDDLVENNISWRKYRIPIAAVLEIATERSPDLAAVTHIRIWFEDENVNARESVELQLSELKFLGSRWEREGIRKQSDETLLAPGELVPYESFFIGEVNNKENPYYIPPFPVYEENGIPEKEQSLSLNFVNIDRDHMVRISKQISPRGDDYTRYEELSWYWYNPEHDQADVDLFFRVGSDTLNYYEVRYRFAEGVEKTGWQRLTVDLAELSNVKNEEPDSTGFALLADSRTGQPLRTRVVGRPDLRSVKRYYFGIVNNQLTSPVSGYFWMNDVMLLAVKRDIGFSERVALRLNMADILKVDFDWARRDAEYRGLDATAGQGYSNEDWNLTSSLRVDDYLPLLGFRLPVNFGHRQTTQLPKYEVNSDIEILDEATSQEQSTYDERQNFSARLSHTPSRSALPRYLIDPWALSLSGSRSYSKSPTQISDQKTLQGAANYDLRITGRYTLAAFPIVGSIPLIRGLAILPNKISFGGNFNANERQIATVDLDGTVAPRPLSKTRPGKLNAAIDYTPLEIVTLNFNARSDRDLLREQRRFGINIGEENQYVQAVKMTFTPPRSTMLPEGKAFALLRIITEGIYDLRPSVTYDGSYSDNHDPNARQPDDPENIRNVSNAGDWEFRFKVPVGDAFTSLFPEKTHSGAQQQQLIDEQRRLEQRQRRRGAEPTSPESGEAGAIDESEGDASPDQPQDPADDSRLPPVAAGEEDLTPEERLERDRQRLLEEAELREQEERDRFGDQSSSALTDSLSAADDGSWDQAGGEKSGGGFKLPNPLTPIMTMLRNINPIQVAYVTRNTSSYTRLQDTAPFWYRVGFKSSLDVADSLFASQSRTDRKSLTLSTSTKISRQISLDVKFGQEKSGRELVGFDTRTYTQDWPDLRFSIGGVERWRIFGGGASEGNGWFRTSTIDLAYKYSKQVPGYTETSYNPRSTTTFTPRWNVTFQSGMSGSLNAGLTKDSSLTNGTETKANRFRIGAQLRHQFRAERLLAKFGLYRPGNQPVITMDVDLSYMVDRTTREVPGRTEDPVPTGQTRIALAPRFSYNVTRNLSGALNFNFNRSKNFQTEQTTTSFGLGLEATFTF